MVWIGILAQNPNISKVVVFKNPHCFRWRTITSPKNWCFVWMVSKKIGGSSFFWRHIYCWRIFVSFINLMHQMDDEELLAWVPPIMLEYLGLQYLFWATWREIGLKPRRSTTSLTQTRGTPILQNLKSVKARKGEWRYWY